MLTLKVCDPACGSGAFLNQALSYFIEEHKFVDDIIAELTNTPLRLFDTDLQILENNIFGVDINEESVEIAKLSMWLRTAQPGRKLSDLSNNIKCGNSLIDDPTVAGNKAFNWEKEFPTVFEKGGFDVVIGNPPYVRRTELKDDIKIGLEKKYYSAHKQYDLYVLFNELALEITRLGGLIGFIQPNKFLSAEYGYKILNLLVNNVIIEKIYDVSLDKVFSEASVYPYIFVFEKRDNNRHFVDSKLNIFNYCTDENLVGFERISDSKEIISKLNQHSYKLCDLTKNIKRGVPNSKIEFTKSIGTNGVKSTLLEFPYFLPKSDIFFNYHDSSDFQKKENEFEQKMILLPRTTLKIRAVLKNEKIHILDRIYYFNIESKDFHLEYVLAILNSKITTFYYNYVFGSTKIGGGYIDLKGSQIENFLIPKSDLKDQKNFVEKSKELNFLYSKYAELIKKFPSLLSSDFQSISQSKKIENWHLFSWSEFEKELKNYKINLLGVQKEDWFDRFERFKKQALEIKTQIDQTQKEIDRMVYELYGLTEEEIQIVENS